VRLLKFTLLAAVVVGLLVGIAAAVLSVSVRSAAPSSSTILGLVIFLRFVGPLVRLGARSCKGARDLLNHAPATGLLAVYALTVFAFGVAIAWPWNIPLAALVVGTMMIWTPQWRALWGSLNWHMEGRGGSGHVGRLYWFISPSVDWGFDVWASDDRSTALDWVLFIGRVRLAWERGWIKHRRYDDGWIFHWIPTTEESWWTRPGSL
jgi:hypothetical protein